VKKLEKEIAAIELQIDNCANTVELLSLYKKHKELLEELLALEK